VSAPGSITRLLSRVGDLPTQAEAQQGLRDVLADPTLDLLWMNPDGVYIAADGRATTLEAQPVGRITTPVLYEGRTVGALIHDPSVLEDPDELGEVAAVIGLAIEKDRINERLRRQRDLLSAIGDATPALLCVIFEDGRISAEGANQATRELVGATHEELAGRLFWEAVVVPEDRPEVERVIREVVNGRPQPDRVSRWRRAAGGQASVAWTCTPLPHVIPQPVFLISGVDVSERERQTQELRDSRSRIVEAADNERRRLERNLHDGAQQRLVSLALSLRRATGQVTSAPEEAVSVLEEATRDLTEAIAELRELARGLHPAILTVHGLGPALRGLAERTPLPVTVHYELTGRLPAPVEAAVYFVVAEALTNAVKHAQADEVVVRLELVDGSLAVAVADDGIGGAAFGGGTGLRGLADRVEAISGHLAVTSDERGTRVTAAIPVSGT
jgi:PAS domain S-box-containing protein